MEHDRTTRSNWKTHLQIWLKIIEIQILNQCDG